MWPLLRKDGLTVQYFVLILLWNRLIGHNPFKTIYTVLSVQTFVHFLSAVSLVDYFRREMILILLLTGCIRSHYPSSLPGTDYHTTCTIPGPLPCFERSRQHPRFCLPVVMEYQTLCSSQLGDNRTLRLKRSQSRG